VRVHVEYTGQVQAALNRKTETMDVPAGGTVESLLVQVADRGGSRVRSHLFTAAGRIQPGLLVAVNGVAGSAAATAARPLAEDDAVIVIVPIAGG